MTACTSSNGSPNRGSGSDAPALPRRKTLQDFIWKHHDWFPDLRRLGLHEFSEQALLDSGRRVDLLCKRRSTKQLVGIELKVLEPDDRAAGQLQQYLDDLADHARNHGYDSAHLIVIAGQPDKSVRNRVERYAATRGTRSPFSSIGCT